jgi:8-oxo-dGTP diphosphatase
VETPRTPDQQGSNVSAPSAIRDVYVIARRRDDILLLLRSGTGYKDGEWGPPSGRVEPGETYTDAAVRELAEETGICVTPGDVRFLHAIERVPGSGNHWVGMFFEVDVASVNPVNREPHKHSGLQFFPGSALPDRTVDYVRHVVDAVRRGEGYSEWQDLDAEDPLERRLTGP